MALKNSYDIENYKIYLYCDGPKNESDNNKINKIKDIIENNNNLKFAKKLYRSENFGLAKNIILSMNEVFTQNEAAIIIEDDIVVNKNAINFINFYLNILNKNEKIGSVSAYSYLDKFNEQQNINYYLSKRHSSWAWGTWSYIWQDIQWGNMNNQDIFKSKTETNGFLELGRDMNLMLWAQSKKYINSWAIRFNYYCYLKNLKSFQSRYSLVNNIGNEGSGTHGFFKSKNITHKLTNDKIEFISNPIFNNDYKKIDLFIKQNHKKSIRLIFYYFLFLIKNFLK